MHQRHAFGDRLQVECPVERRIAAADDDEIVAAEFLHAPHRIKDALAFIVLDARDGRALGLKRTAAGGDHHHLGLEHFALVGGDPETAILQLFKARDHAVEGEFGLERMDLLHQLVDQALRRDRGPAWNVVDRLFRVELGALPAGAIENVDEMAFHVEEAELEHGEQADRPCSDNENVCLDGIGHARRPVGNGARLHERRSAAKQPARRKLESRP